MVSDHFFFSIHHSSRVDSELPSGDSRFLFSRVDSWFPPSGFRISPREDSGFHSLDTTFPLSEFQTHPKRILDFLQWIPHYPLVYSRFCLSGIWFPYFSKNLCKLWNKFWIGEYEVRHMQRLHSLWLTTFITWNCSAIESKQTKAICWLAKQRLTAI